MNVVNYINTFPRTLVLIFVFYHLTHQSFEKFKNVSKGILLKKKENMFSLRLYQDVLKKITWTVTCMLSHGVISLRSTLRDGFKRSVKGVGRGKSSRCLLLIAQISNIRDIKETCFPKGVYHIVVQLSGLRLFTELILTAFSLFLVN